MNRMEQALEMLENKPELTEKLFAEAERLIAGNEAAGTQEALISAAKTVLGVDFAGEAGENGKLDLEELDAVSGGVNACGHAEYKDYNEEEKKKHDELVGRKEWSFSHAPFSYGDAVRDLQTFYKQMDEKYGDPKQSFGRRLIGI